MNSNTLYIAHRAKADDVVPASLQERGIRYLRSSPCNVDIVVHGQNLSYKYAAYVHNLPAAMLAQTSIATVSVEAHHYYQCTEKDLLPIPQIIDIAFAFSRVDSELEAKLTSLQAIQMTFRNKMIYIVRYSRLELLRPLVSDERLNRICSTPDNVMNVDSFLCFCVMSRIAHAFLQTHMYPTYASKEQSELSKKRKFDTNAQTSSSSSSSSNVVSIPPVLLDVRSMYV